MSTIQLPQRRIPILDIIRGIALLGILIMNIQTYSLFAFLRPEQVYALQLDRPETYQPTQFLVHFFVKGQFYTIYSFLFGLGFYLLWKKNQQAGLPADRLFKRRLWVLLVVGLIHAFIFWFGDVLHKYALLGFSLLYFNRQSIQRIVRWIIGLIAAVLLVQVVKLIAFPPTAISVLAGQQEMDKVVMEVVQTWQHGSIGEVMSMQKLGVAMLWFMSLESGFAGLVHFEVLFLLGLIAGKLTLFERLDTVKPVLTKILWRILPLAVILKGIGCEQIWQEGYLALPLPLEKFVTFTGNFLGTPLLTIVYLISLVLLFSHRREKMFQWIAVTGRMGLSNYLLQTLLCMGLFYGYALGLAGRLSLLDSFIPVILIYIFQVLLSNLWFNKFGQGPMERLWRRLTYGRRRSKVISKEARDT